jgi:hypothetical protein
VSELARLLESLVVAPSPLSLSLSSPLFPTTVHSGSGSGSNLASQRALNTSTANEDTGEEKEEELGTVYLVLDQCQRLVDAAVPVGHDGGMRSLVRFGVNVFCGITTLQWLSSMFCY